MLTMSAALRTPIGDLVLTACEAGLVAIEFVDVSADKDRELANYKMTVMATNQQKAEFQPRLNSEQGFNANPNETRQLSIPLATPRNSRCSVIQQPHVLSNGTVISPPAELTEKIAEMLLAGLTQLTEYFAKTRHEFALPLAANGSQFQQQVWYQLGQIPYGKHCSYGDIANAILRPKAVRAVGAANGRNPLAIVVPCHRVIGQNGSMTGYAGGLARKIWLLDHEQQGCEQ